MLDDKEYQQIKRAARRQGLTLSEWVRRSLAEARSSQPSAEASKKLAVVRAAAEHAVPTADIAQMLREIEQGYIEGS